jgi:hypothetical protein
MIPVFEQAKTFHALDHVVTVTGHVVLGFSKHSLVYPDVLTYVFSFTMYFSSLPHMFLVPPVSSSLRLNLLLINV